MTRNTRPAPTAAERRQTITMVRHVAGMVTGFNGVAAAAYFVVPNGILWPFVIGLVVGIAGYGYALWCEHVR